MYNAMKKFTFSYKEIMLTRRWKDRKKVYL